MTDNFTSESEKLEFLVTLAGHFAQTLDSFDLTTSEVASLLQLASTAAHDVVRPAAPLATFALGMLVARDPGLNILDAVDQVRASIAEFEKDASAQKN